MGRVLFISVNYVCVLGPMCFITAAYCLFLYCRVNHGGFVGGGLSVGVVRERSLVILLVCGIGLFLRSLGLDFRFVCCVSSI